MRLVFRFAQQFLHGKYEAIQATLVGSNPANGLVPL